MTHAVTHTDPDDAAKIAASFPDRGAAERAASSVRDAAPDAEVEVDVAQATGGDPTAGPARVTVAASSPATLERAAAALRAAGGDVAAKAPDYDAPPPRAVQPGFADARPGFIPDAAPFPDNRPETDQAQGRFADQLDHLPEDRDRR